MVIVPPPRAGDAANDQFRPLHWVLTKYGRAVAVPDGRVEVAGSGGSWKVIHHRNGVRPAVLVRGVPYRDALEFAEGYARSSGAGRLADPTAAWRRRPATEGQLAVLRRRRSRIWPDMTAGEASDLITSGTGGGDD